MNTVGKLKTSEHEIRFFETKEHYYYYTFDINKSSQKSIKTTCYIVLQKSMLSYAFNSPKMQELAKYPQIIWTYTNSSYVGQNIPTELYAFIIEKHEGLWSDIKHSIGATKIWSKLSNLKQVNLIDANKNKILLQNTRDPIKDKWYLKKEYMLLALNVPHNT